MANPHDCTLQYISQGSLEILRFFCGTMLAKAKVVGKKHQINPMKIAILSLVMMALVTATLAGCERQAINDTTVSTNSASGQPMPGANSSNNVTKSPAVPDNNTNNPAVTNWSNTNNSGATNQ
jgi:hypothetical protein